jgi:hypothetical protein
MGTPEIEAFLTNLAVNENVAVSTQNQAPHPHAVLFLYKEVLKKDLDLKVDAVRVKKCKYLPTVLTTDEISLIILRSHRASMTQIVGLKLNSNFSKPSHLDISLRIELIFCTDAIFVTFFSKIFNGLGLMG